MFNKSNFSVVMLIIALVFCPDFFLFAQSTPSDTYKTPLYEDLSRAYGYYDGQRMSIEQIQEKFPTLAAEARKAQIEFDLVFKSSYKTIEKELKKILGDKWSEYQIQMQEQSQKMITVLRISEDQAKAFIKEVGLRAKGRVESPVIETLLTYDPIFQKNPEEEFLRGFTWTYRTKNHPKAKGIDFQIQYPMSWKAKEGNRPNVIKLITSENGRGFDNIGLMVKDVPLPADYKITEEELDDFFRPASLKEMIPEGALFVSAKPIVLDNHKGGMLIFDQVQQRLDIILKMRNLHFITIYGNKMISIQCMSASPDTAKSALEQRFKKMESLFRLIGNSFVIQSQY